MVELLPIEDFSANETHLCLYLIVWFKLRTRGMIEDLYDWDCIFGDESLATFLMLVVTFSFNVQTLCSTSVPPAELEELDYPLAHLIYNNQHMPPVGGGYWAYLVQSNSQFPDELTDAWNSAFL